MTEKQARYQARLESKIQNNSWGIFYDPSAVLPFEIDNYTATNMNEAEDYHPGLNPLDVYTAGEIDL